MVVFMRISLINKPEIVFVILALIFGLVFVVINQPLAVSDECSHFYKAFDVSQSHLIPQSQIIQMPMSIVILSSVFTLTEPTNFTKIYSYLQQPLNINETYNVNVSNIAIYPPLPYLASGAVIFLGSLSNSSPLFLMYLGRLINLLIYIVLIYFAIKIIPVHKYVLFLVALMPMTLYQAASLSADSLNLGLCFLTISFFLYLALVKDKTSNKDILISLILVFALSFSKQAYAIATLLIFMIPKEKFEKRFNRLISFFIILLPSLITTIYWNHLFKYLYHAPILDGLLTSPEYNIHFILSNPLNLPTILINTWIYFMNCYITQFVGVFRYPYSSLPFSLAVLFCIFLVFVSLLDNFKYKLSFKQKLIPLFIFSMVSFLVFLFEFISYTPIGYTKIVGVQGRYFMPIIPLFLLLFYNTKLSNYLSSRFMSKVLNNKLKANFISSLYIFVILFLMVSSYIIYYAVK
jgi:uncharacterized membrane protein